MPVRLAPVKVATPDGSVDALPTEFPFSVKLIDAPFTAFPPDVSVALSVVVPPNAPDAGDTASVVGWVDVIGVQLENLNDPIRVCQLFAAFVVGCGDS